MINYPIKIRKNKGKIPASKYEEVMKDITRLHYSKSEALFERNKLEILAKWRRYRDLKIFTEYFNKQWLEGQFVNWQIFNTPPGFASTNGPIESYNNTIKRFFTNRVKYNMLPALTILISQVAFESERDSVFYNDVLPPLKLVDEARSQLNEKSNGLMPMKNSNTQFKFELNRKSSLKIELSEECKCSDCCYCSCSIFLDKGYCVHLLMACLYAKISFPGIMVIKAFRQKKSKGRPKNATKALNL